MLKLLISKLDQIICFYLGLENEELRPHKVQRQGQHLWVKHASPFKRHTMSSAWEDLPVLKAENLENLGQQAGQSMAKELIVTFKEPTIRMNTHA